MDYEFLAWADTLWLHGIHHMGILTGTNRPRGNPMAARRKREWLTKIETAKYGLGGLG